MQYILTADEYRELQTTALIAKAKVVGVVQDLCTRVADNEPIILRDADGTIHEQTVGCMLSCEDDEGVCDNCPVQNVCPCDHKTYSK